MAISTPAIAQSRLKVQIPALFILILAFNNDLARFLKRELVAGAVKSVVQVEKAKVVNAMWWGEGLIYVYIIANIIEAYRALYRPPMVQAKPVPTPSSSAIKTVPVELSSSLTNGYLPSPTRADRPSIPRPSSSSSSSSLRLRSSQSASSPLSQSTSNPMGMAPLPLTTTTQATGAQPSTSFSTPTRPTASGNPSTTTPAPPSPSLSQLIQASRLRHSESLSRSLLLSSTSSSPRGKPISPNASPEAAAKLEEKNRQLTLSALGARGSPEKRPRNWWMEGEVGEGEFGSELLVGGGGGA